MVNQVLVTTALEETWPADGAPILFLGEWCKLFERQYKWEKLNYSVIPYHWDDREKLYQDYRHLTVIYEEALQALTVELNKRHGVSHSLRYWRIFLGPWLAYFIQIVFDRWFMLTVAIASEHLDVFRIIKRYAGEGVPNDMAEFCTLFVGDDWNEIIYGQILDFLSVPTIQLEVSRTIGQMHVGVRRTQETYSTRLKRRLIRVAAQLSGALANSEEFFFISSYLGIQQDFFLQMRLGQLPKLWCSPAIPRFEYSETVRQWELLLPQNQVDTKAWGNFRKLLGFLIPKHIPIAYLEGYVTLNNIVGNLVWPKQPRLIFTSNSYDSDDFFKIWAAEKVDKGVPLVIGQHGGNFGMASWNFSEEHQIAISDRFLTWGWGDSTGGALEAIGNFKGGRYRKIQQNKAGKALLIGMALPRYSYHMYAAPVSAVQMENYFEDQFQFVNALPKRLHADLLVRLYASDYDMGQVSRWRSRFPDIELDAGSCALSQLLKQTRLYISTYNATTYLESLSNNIPTLIFWDPIYWELREGVQPYFDLLKEVGIFHETPESAAQQMTQVWDDINSWWNDSKIQKARVQFCDRYTRISKPLNTMAQLFRTLSEDACMKV